MKKRKARRRGRATGEENKKRWSSSVDGLMGGDALAWELFCHSFQLALLNSFNKSYPAQSCFAEHGLGSKAVLLAPYLKFDFEKPTTWTRQHSIAHFLNPATPAPPNLTPIILFVALNHKMLRFATVSRNRQPSASISHSVPHLFHSQSSLCSSFHCRPCSHSAASVLFFFPFALFFYRNSQTLLMLKLKIMIIQPPHFQHSGRTTQQLITPFHIRMDPLCGQFYSEPKEPSALPTPAASTVMVTATLTSLPFSSSKSTVVV